MWVIGTVQLTFLKAVPHLFTLHYELSSSTLGLLADGSFPTLTLNAINLEEEIVSAPPLHPLQILFG